MIRPTANRVLVRMETEKIDSIIHMPESFSDGPQWGTVMAVGPKVVDLKEGNRVFFTPQRSFNEFVISGIRHKLFRETDLEAMA